MMNTQTMSAPASGGMTNLLLGLGAVGLIIGIIAASALMSEGHSAFNVNSNVPWGLPIIGYVFFALTSTGLAIVASLAMVFGMKDFYPIAKRCIWLAIAVLIAGFISLSLELGHPFRLLWAIPTGMQTDSPMFWMGVWYAVALAFMVVKFALLMSGDWSSPVSKSVGIITFGAEIAAAMTLGLVFGAMAMRPFWYDPTMPVYFVLSGLASGIAFAILFVNLAYGMNQNRMPEGVRKVMTGALPCLFAAALGVVLLFTVGRAIIGLWTNAPETRLVMQEVVSSGLFQFKLWVGMVLPLVLLLIGLGRQTGVQMLAAVLVVVALFSDRYEYITGGQMVPMFKGAWFPDLVSYSPSIPEIGLVVLGGSIGLLIYAVGDKMFNLSDSPTH